MIARLHNNGCEVRVDLGNTGQDWPNCRYQPGFPWLSFGRGTWQAAEDWAREHGATEIIRTQSPQAWARELGGFDGRCGTHPEDLPCVGSITAKQFWGEYANTSGGG